MAAPMRKCMLLVRAIKTPSFASTFGRNPSFYQVTRCISETSSLTTDSKDVAKSGGKSEEKISRAMQAYIERAEAHDKFMKSEIAEFEMGKRHLANIMNCDVDNFNQADIDAAIRYLLPSGLFEKKARPILKHPEDIFPKKKAVQFSPDGRPFHHLFYTARANFYDIMGETVKKHEELKMYEDDMVKKGFLVPPEHIPKLIVAGSEWISYQTLKDKVLENISEHDYNRFIVLHEVLVKHPYASQIKDYIMQYRVPLKTQAKDIGIAEPKTDIDGKRYTESEGSKKRAKASVRIYEKGTGKFIVNKKPLIDYFPQLKEREILMYPLQFTGKLGTVDIEAIVDNSGITSQAAAIRYATSKALTGFVSEDTIEKMRLAGLLTWDFRHKERKKPGQEKARKKFTWKKR